MICESNVLDNYLLESEEVDYFNASIRETAWELTRNVNTEIETVKRVFEFVRDEIHHSWDIQSSRVTCRASEVLYFKEGICYAKSHLMAALLRCLGIPAGFCYQRLTLGETPDTGYCIHALNVVFLKSIGRWIRLDPRGNKAGIDAQFSIDVEKLAFPIRVEYNEIDYPTIYCNPHPKTIIVLKENTDCLRMYQQGLPSEL
jgi:transglutaminase-like putative cysteine protease